MQVALTREEVEVGIDRLRYWPRGQGYSWVPGFDGVQFDDIIRLGKTGECPLTEGCPVLLIFIYRQVNTQFELEDIFYQWCCFLGVSEQNYLKHLDKDPKYLYLRAKFRRKFIKLTKEEDVRKHGEGIRMCLRSY